jgi:hypothetical protein
VNEDLENIKYTYNTGLEMQILDNEGHPDEFKKNTEQETYDLIKALLTCKTCRGNGIRQIVCKFGRLTFVLNDVL